MNRSWADFLAMGGYAQYVWPAYLVALGAVLVTTLSARRALARSRTAARLAGEDAAGGP